ncbi:hypothetical protein T01_10318 [Trichinella spiralis]|uniref:Uncharacterized protein n=1 Tax=Trichinella spiralis TaxID=6334 RepID=A0A0V1B8R4_TRISP|nr:hypothetical protein T01_10318 [Trichinella spiralis]
MQMHTVHRCLCYAKHRKLVAHICISNCSGFGFVIYTNSRTASLSSFCMCLCACCFYSSCLYRLFHRAPLIVLAFRTFMIQETPFLINLMFTVCY